MKIRSATFQKYGHLQQVGGNMEAAQRSAAGSNSDVLVVSLWGFRKYLQMAGIFYQAFQVKKIEHRGVLWWSLHRLLEQPQDGVRFGELLDHLVSVSGSSYSKHVVGKSLVEIRDKGYLSLANPKTGENISITELKVGTIIRLDTKIYERISMYATLFKKSIVDAPQILSIEDIELYQRVNYFFRAQYVPIWNSAIADIVRVGQSCGAKCALPIEERLKHFDSHWVLINLLSIHYLESEINGTEKNLSFNDINHEFNQNTYISRSDLEETLDEFLAEKVRLVEMKKVKGHRTYSIAESFHSVIARFGERVSEGLRKFLLSL